MLHKKGALHWEELAKLLIVIFVLFVLLAIVALLVGIFTDKLDLLKNIFRFR